MEGGDFVTSASAVAVQDVWVRRGDRSVLEAVSFEVCHGEVVALKGASESGKTTLLRAMAGLDVLERGRMVIDRVTIEAGRVPQQTMSALRRAVGMVFQFHGLFEHLSAVDNVVLALIHVHGVAATDARDRGHAILRRLGVEHRAGTLPRELSGGEAQRVAIARSLAVDPPVLLMDEPTASLDPDRRMELADLARALAGQRRAVVVATHDAEFAEAVATRVLRVVDRRVREEAR